MNLIKKSVLASSGILGVLSVPLASVHAMCPICTVAIIGGLGILERYGVDDLVSGLWIGALIVSTAMWTITWLQKKNWNFRFYKPVTWIGYFAIVLIPLYTQGFIFSPVHHSYFLGIDRLFFAIAAGSIVFFAAAKAYQMRKQKYGKALYPFQKVVQPVGVVLLATIVAYFISFSY